MPNLQTLRLAIKTMATIGQFQPNTFDCGLDNLPSLRHVVVHLLLAPCPEVADTIRKAVNDHPKHPSLDFD
jgi:hypothetical protein